MKKTAFIHDDFLLETPQARRLFHDYAEDLPIIDYHCHLPPDQVARDHHWENMTQIWLRGDHYKWRALRANGVPERFCTGDASDVEKFEKWAEIMPALLRNPLHHWTHLELARHFNVTQLLDADSAKDIWETCNKHLADPAFSCRNLMKRSHVVLVCTTDDPTDTLEHHRTVARDKSFTIQMLPTWRPDKGMAIENPKTFNAWIDKLEALTGLSIKDLDTFREALLRRHDFFHASGCRLSDHGIETIYASDWTDRDLRVTFKVVRGGKPVPAEDIIRFKSAMLHEFAVMDQAKGWTQQFHLGILRNNNSRMFETIGPDTGFDSIGDFECSRAMSRFFDRLNRDDRLARTLVYNSNPRDNAMIATMMGNFQDGITPGKMQFGSGWWFMDQKNGIERQLEDLSQMGLLSRFVGMLTDSRSFLSYTRHEYFRRILCNLLGRDMDRGLIPTDFKLVGNMIKDIGYNNAARYFGFKVPVLK